VCPPNSEETLLTVHHAEGYRDHGTPRGTLRRSTKPMLHWSARQSRHVLYAMGWTQHTVASKISCNSIIQSLLGNMGIAGGGVKCPPWGIECSRLDGPRLLYHIWPAYLPAPHARLATLDDYNKTTPSSKDPRSVNWWKNRPKYLASFLKSTFGTRPRKKTISDTPGCPSRPGSGCFLVEYVR